MATIGKIFIEDCAIDPAGAVNALRSTSKLPVRRVQVDGEFEADPAALAFVGAFARAFVDIGSPYSIIPHKVHQRGIAIHQDLGRQPCSMSGIKSLQPFAEVGLRFLVCQPVLAYRPPHFVRVKAYLLEPNVLPSKVVIGLDTIEQYFTLYLPPPPAEAFLLEPGESIP